MPFSIYAPTDGRYNNPTFNQYGGYSGAGAASTPTGGGTNGLPNYNTSPAPTSGQGPYGAVPGTIGVPPSPWQQTIGSIPALGNTSQLTGNIMSELQGDINPQALKNMQDAAAAYGVSSGMPGSNAIPGTLAFNKNLRNIGLDTQAIQHQGAQDYNSLLGAVAGLQTPQSLAAEIAAHNAQLKAAPDPTQAALQQQRDYWNALNATRGPGGGTGGVGYSPAGGTGRYAPQTPFVGGTPSPQYPGSSGGGGFAPDPLYPGTEFQGQPNLGSLLGPQNPYYGTPQAPVNVGTPYGGDASSQQYWNFNQQDPYSFDQSAQPNFSGYDQAFSNPEDYYAGILAGGMY